MLLFVCFFKTRSAVLARYEEMFKVLNITATSLWVPVPHVLTLDTLAILTFIVIIQWHPLHQLTTVPLTLLFNIIKVVPDEAHTIF